MKSVEELDVYQLTFEFTTDVYKITETFPRSELFGLVSQMRRAVISINSNLTEGYSRGSTPDYRRFVGIAKGSAAELSYQIKISNKLGFIDNNVCNNMVNTANRINQMLSKLFKSLEQKNTKPEYRIPNTEKE